MKKIKLSINLFTILIITLMTSCCNNNTPSSNKSVKFEITGNYTGHIFILYNDSISGNSSLTATSLPWKTIDYQK